MLARQFLQRAHRGTDKTVVGTDPSRLQEGDLASALRWVEGRVPDALSDALHRSALVEANWQRALFRLRTVGRFLVEPDRPTVVERARGATDQDIECFLRGPVAALRLLLSGHFALRGSAVEVDGRALGILGIATGTSSLAAALAMEGHAVLADGLVWVEDSPPAIAAVPETQPPRITLWPDSVEALGLAPSEGKVVRPVLSSRAFVLGPPSPPGPVPLGAFVSLGSPEGRDFATKPQRVSGFGAVATILKSYWHPHLVGDLGLAKKQFRWAAALAGSTPTALLPVGPGEIGPSLGLLASAALGVLQ